MNDQTILVTAKPGHDEGVYIYDMWTWEVQDGKGGFFFKKPWEIVSCNVTREIVFRINPDLTWRASSDCVYDYGQSYPADACFRTPDIASDDVGNDMLELAMSEAYPEAYHERCHRLEQQAKEKYSEKAAHRYMRSRYGM